MSLCQKWALPCDSITRKWATRLSNVSSQLDDDLHAAKWLCGPPYAFPDCHLELQPSLWTPRDRGAQYQFCEMEFEHPLRVAALEIFEATYTGGVCRIAFRDPLGEWSTVFHSEHVKHVRGSRQFVPNFKRPHWKTDAIRVDIQQPNGGYVQIGTVALYGFDEEFGGDNRVSLAFERIVDMLEPANIVRAYHAARAHSSLDLDTNARDQSMALDAFAAMQVREHYRPYRRSLS